MTFQLKNVSRKRDQASMAISTSELGDEGVSARLAERGKDPLWRRLLHNKPMIHEDDAVGGVARKAHLTADHQHGHATALELAHDVENAAHELRIERGGGLVKQHHLGFQRERASDRHSLLLAARKLAGIRPCLVGKSDPIEGRHAETLRFGTWLAQHLDKRKRDVSQRRHMGIEVERLKHHADLTPHRVDVGGTRRDIDPADVHRAGRWLLQTVAATQQGTLACSRGSDDKHEFLRQYARVNAAQYLDVAEFVAE